VLVTNRCIALMDENLTKIIHKVEHDVVACDIQENSVLVALLGGQLLHLKVQHQKLQAAGQLNVGHEITSVALAGNTKFGCVSLFDAPLYSLLILKLEEE
jgi:hypothetical protein